MNGITFIRGQGGLGRRLPGEDHVSGLIVSTGTPGTPNTPYLFRSIEEAEAAGITPGTRPVAHYHIAEFFRICPGAKLYVRLVQDLDYSFVEVKQLQSNADGSIRQIGIQPFMLPAAGLAAAAGTLQAVCDELAADSMPLSAIIVPAVSSSDLIALPDLHALNAPRVSVCIAQDGGGYGAHLYNETGDLVSALGALLGTVAKARVSDSIGWVERYNAVTAAYPATLTGGALTNRELDVAALADGTRVASLTPAQLQIINEKGYIFLRKHTGATGSYWNDSFTCDALTGDYAYIENNRVIDKACRGVYAALLPRVSGPAYVDPATGNLTEDSVAAMEEIAMAPLEQMQRDGEVSGAQVYIDPAQPVLSTSRLNVVIKIVPVGVLRQIEVTIGFTLQLTE